VKPLLTGNLGKIILGDPGVPVLAQSSLGCTSILELAKGVLVYDSIVTSRLEESRLMVSLGLTRMEGPTVMKGSVTSH